MNLKKSFRHINDLIVEKEEIIHDGSCTEYCSECDNNTYKQTLNKKVMKESELSEGMTVTIRKDLTAEMFLHESCVPKNSLAKMNFAGKKVIIENVNESSIDIQGHPYTFPFHCIEELLND